MKRLSTQLQIKNAKAGVYNLPGASGFGFKKESDAVGVGSYTVRFRLGDRRPTMGLGSFAEISMAEAREAAKAAVALARKGIDPIEQRRREKAANLAAKKPVDFKQATEAHYEVLAPTLKHKYAGPVWLNPIKKYAYPILGHLSVNDIVAEHVAAVLRSAAADGNLETGKRVQQRIRAILNGAIARGERDPLRGNPVDAGLIAAILPLKRKGARPHFRRIKLDDAPATFRAFEEAQARAAGLQAVALDGWMFMGATCARPGEAIGAKWSEIDLDKKLWTLPAARSKSGREHVTPLNSAAFKVLERRLETRSGDGIFGGRSGSSISHTRFAIAPAEAGIDAGTPHSWRSIFRDWCGDVARVDRDLAEASLGHSLGSTEASYRRQSAVEARRPVMEAYAKWLCGEAGADILAFPSRA